MDADTRALIEVLRPMLKGYMRQTRNVLAFVAELDKRLSQLETDSQEAYRDQTEEARA